jgi:hypothetical protein
MTLVAEARLRVLRYNHRWRTPPGHEIRYGGDNPLELVYEEKLQQFIDGQWQDVPVVVEERIPEDPRELKRRREREERRIHMDRLNAELKKSAQRTSSTGPG